MAEQALSAPSDHRMRGAGRAIVIATALAGAFLCVLSAADREAGNSRSLPALLSAIDFGSDHKRAQVIAALDDENFQRAAKIAREAVRRDPLNGGAPSLLGAALLGNYQPDAADAAFRVAGQMGWRDAGVQSYWLIQTLGTDNFDIAAQRLDALLRSHEPSDFTAHALVVLEGSAGGRAALARRLAYSPDWAVWYLRTLLSEKSPTLEHRSETMIAAAKLGLSLPSRQFDPILVQLVADGHYGLAHSIDAALDSTAPAAALGVVDGDFRAPVDPKQSKPFGWRYFQTGDVSVDRDPNAPGRLGSALRISSTAATMQLVARQILALPPGRHAMNWHAVDRSGSPTTALTLGLKCRDSGVALVRPQFVGAAQTSAAFEVPNSGCADQELRIMANPPSTGGTMTAWITGISVTND